MKRRNVFCVLLIVLLVLLVTSSSLGENDFKKSDIFYAYPRILREPEPIIDQMYRHAVQHISDMEDNGSEILGILQSALTDPEGGTADGLWAWISGQDKMEERCSFDAIESMLEIIAQDGYTGYENEVQSVMKGLYDSLLKDEKEIVSLTNLNISIFKFWLENHSDKLGKTIDVLYTYSGDYFDTLHEMRIPKKDFIEDVMGDLSEETDWLKLVSEAGDKAGDFFDIVNMICLLETIDDNVLYTLQYSLSSDGLKSAVGKYIHYKNENFSEYITARYMDSWLIDAAKGFISDKLKDITNECLIGGKAFNAFYSVTKGAMKLIGKIIGKVSGIGDGDKFATAYYSWNIAQELEMKLNNLRAQLITAPIYHENIQDYEAVYLLYAQAIHNFDVSVGACDENYKKTTLKADEDSLSRHQEEHGSAFDMYVWNCLRLLGSAEDPEEYRRPVDPNDIPEYEFSGEFAIRGPSDELEDNTIYTAPDGDLFYGLHLIDWTTADIQADCVIQGDLTIDRGRMHTITIPEGVTVRIRGNYEPGEFRERYYDTTGPEYVAKRRLEIHGALLVEGDMKLNVSTFILSGQHASLEVDGALTIQTNNTYGNVAETIDGECIALRGNVSAPASFMEIGNTAIYLQLDSGEIAETRWISLSEPEGGFVGDMAADLLLKGQGFRNDTFWDDFRYAELTGNAPSHFVKISRTIQRGESNFAGLSSDCSNIAGKLDVSGNMTVGEKTFVDGELHVGGNVEIINTKDTLYYISAYKPSYAGTLTVGEGALLTVDGDFSAVCTDSSEYGKRTLTVSGTAQLNGNLTIKSGALSLDQPDSLLVVMGDVYAGGSVALDDGLIQLHGDGDFSSLSSFDQAKIVFMGERNEEATFRFGLSNRQKFEIHGTGKDSNLTVYTKDTISTIDGDIWMVHLAPTDPTKAINGSSLNILSWGLVLDDGVYDFAETTLDYESKFSMNGKYVFNGNMTIDKTKLTQDEEDSSIEVKGNLHLKNAYQVLNAGTLTVGGDITLTNSSSLTSQAGHQTILNGTGVQRLAWDESEELDHYEYLSFSTLTLENESAEGVILGDPVYVHTLLNHQRHAFTLKGTDETRFADYDGDGVRDPWDPKPTDASVSSILFTVSPIEDQEYTGDPITPALTVVDEEGLAMEEGKDYTVTWEDNINSATAKAIVHGLGFHQTEVSAEFAVLGIPVDVYPGPNDAILRISASIRKLADEAFADCPNVRFIYFEGDMPQFGNNVFSGVAKDAVIYYPEGNTTWSAETLKEYGIKIPILPWKPQRVD